MKIFLIGDVHSNGGPSNVNRYLVQNSDINYANSKNKVVKKIQEIRGLFSSKCIVFSGYDKHTIMYNFIAHLFRKKTIYLMHGYIKFENENNNLGLSNKVIKYEEKIFKKIDLILPVSENFSKWFLELKPEYKNKTHYLNNGIDTSKIDFTNNNSNTRIENSIVVTGGNRNIKNNKLVADVVSTLKNNGKDCHLSIYGRIYDNNEKIIENKNIKIMNMRPQEELYDELHKSKLYILDTMMESFGLSVVDALICGCNVLVSKNAGICSILKLNDNDIINDYSDKDEIKKKILYNLNNNNNERILSSIDYEYYSWTNVAKRLKSICNSLYSNEDYKLIK